MEPMARRMWWIGGPIVAFFFVGGLVFWKTLPQIGIGQIWVAVSVFLAVLYGGITAVTGRKARERARVLREGLRGTAEVLSAEGTGVYVNRRPRVRLRLRVQLPGRAPYETEHVETLPWVTHGGLDAGLLEVAVDRDDPNRLAIDWSRPPTPARPGAVGAAPARPALTPGTAAPAVTGDATGVAARLAQLEALHRQGLISAEEFTEQRRRVLGEI